MLGTGILAIPAVVATVGYIPGLALFLLAMLLSLLGQYLIVVSLQHGNSVSLLECFRQHGQYWQYAGLLFDFAIALKSLGVSASYLMVIGDGMSTTLSSDAIGGAYSNTTYSNFLPSARNLWITSMMVLVVGPLSLRKSMGALQRFSLAGICVAIYLLFMAALIYIKADHGAVDIDPVNKVTVENVVNSFTVLVFSFTCHQNVPTVYRESGTGRSSKCMLRIIVISIIITGAIYSAFAALSYLTFGRLCRGNIFLNYENMIAVDIGRAMVSVLAALTIPLQMIPFRLSVTNMLAVAGVGCEEEGEDNVMLGKREKFVTFMALSMSYVIAIVMQDLRAVIAVIGQVAGIPVCYFLPPSLYYMVKADSRSKLLTITAGALVLVGVLVQLLNREIK
jgi:amino acid permease